MATSKNKATRKASGSSNQPNVTPAIVRKDFATMMDADRKSEVALSTVRRSALMLTTSDASLILEWSRQWEIRSSKGGGTEGEGKRKAAVGYFMEWFGVSTVDDNKTVEAKDANAARTRALNIAHLCVAVHTLKYADGFDFQPDGTTFINRTSALGKALWSHKAYDKQDSLKSEGYMKTHPFINVQSRANQVHPGDVSWNDIMTLCLKATGDGRTAAGGTVPTARLNMGLSTPLKGLKALADSAEANKGAYALNTAKVAAMVDAEKILRVAFNGPLFTAGWEHVEKGFAMWRGLLGKQPTAGPAPSLADAKGAEVIDMLKRKGDVISPESAKSLPHLDNPANADKPKGKRASK